MKTMNYTDKLENNPYISDQAAYQEVTTLLKRATAIHSFSYYANTYAL